MNTCPDKADADDTASGAVAFNSAEKGSSGLPMHMLYLGSRRGRGFGEGELSHIGNLVVEEFGSFTMFPAAGFYPGKTLPSLVIKIGARDTGADTYGGSAPHGGGAFSGKDPSKVVRSAAYMGRFLAKQIVPRGWAARALVQLSYAIGVSHPISVYVNTHGTGQVDENKLSKILQEMVGLSPRAIREYLGLNKPIYYRTAAYGHFGRKPEKDGGFSWEKVDLVNKHKKAFGA